MKNRIVITDTSCFILLDKINALHILHQLFTEVITTSEIASEYGAPLPDWVIVENPVWPLEKGLLKRVDPGEASAIALALEISCDYIILDDIAARKLAEKLGLPVKGTVGILLEAKQQGTIPLLRPFLELIQKTNFRLSPQLVEEFIRKADE